ncbi:MAG: transposase family protein [Mycoplasmataceae bacterium]|nr:transposase family protein [Mycoplasmataceae bacterium]
MKKEMKYMWKIIWNERQLKALVWLWEEEFIFLSELFWAVEDEMSEESYQKRLKDNNGKNVRIGSASGTSKLKTSEEKLFFLLSYLKSYPTFDVHGFNFWLCRSGAWQRINNLLPILKRLLQNMWVSPKRILEKPEDLKEAFWWDILELIVDWTERKHFRHKKDSLQKKL